MYELLMAPMPQNSDNAGMLANPESLDAVAARLKKLRQASGLKQTPWANRIGISPNAWNNYELGLRMISREAALQLCRAADVSLDWIYRGKTSQLPADLAAKLNSRPTK